MSVDFRLRWIDFQYPPLSIDQSHSQFALSLHVNIPKMQLLHSPLVILAIMISVTGALAAFRCPNADRSQALCLKTPRHLTGPTVEGKPFFFLATDPLNLYLQRIPHPHIAFDCFRDIAESSWHSQFEVVKPSSVGDSYDCGAQQANCCLNGWKIKWSRRLALPEKPLKSPLAPSNPTAKLLLRPPTNPQDDRLPNITCLCSATAQPAGEDYLLAAPTGIHTDINALTSTGSCMPQNKLTGRCIPQKKFTTLFSIYCQFQEQGETDTRQYRPVRPLLSYEDSHWYKKNKEFLDSFPVSGYWEACGRFRNEYMHSTGARAGCANFIMKPFGKYMLIINGIIIIDYCTQLLHTSYNYIPLIQLFQLTRIFMRNILFSVVTLE
ncbi:hypothetical protein VP01_2128g2 [Puccinia sorghi]|uniref:Uncharacterized protein n=1 Tax=Puccinia sorghi TaxID=27349 RepID=A0A0L6VA15_9BASI|nr:hypothetical protein VP01_2128g2 [Puccinia sorghi]